MREEQKREEAVQRRRERAIPIRDDRDVSIGYALENAREGESVAVRLEGNGIAGLVADGDIRAGQSVATGPGGLVHLDNNYNSNLSRAVENVRGNINFGIGERRITLEDVEVHLHADVEQQERAMEAIRQQLLEAAVGRDFFISDYDFHSRDVHWEVPPKPKDKVVMKWQKEIKMRWD
jgi:hypothetical protein